MTNDFKLMNISDIKVGDNRVRKTLTGIETMAESIKRFGLLHPIGVGIDGCLLYGHRRLEAHKLLKMDTIQVKVWPVKEGDEFDIEMAENKYRAEITFEDRGKRAMEMLKSMPERKGRPSKSLENIADKLVASGDQFPEYTPDSIAETLDFSSLDTMYRTINLIEGVEDGTLVRPVLDAVNARAISPHRAYYILKKIDKNKQITELNKSLKDPQALSDPDANKKNAKERRKAKRIKKWEIRDQCRGTPERNFGVIYLDLNWFALLGPDIDALTDPVHCLLTPSYQAIFCKTDVRGIPTLMAAAEQWHWLYQTYFALEPAKPFPKEICHPWLCNDGWELLFLFTIKELPPEFTPQRFLLANTDRYAILDAISKFCPRFAKLDFQGKKKYKEWKIPTDTSFK